jgi:hypothetical protein
MTTHKKVSAWVPKSHVEEYDKALSRLQKKWARAAAP